MDSQTTCVHESVCRRSAAFPGDDKCILHSETPDKNVDQFNAAFREHIASYGYDFRHFIFPVSLTFEGERFSVAVNCSDAIFREEVKFGASVFENEASFERAKFLNTVSFDRAMFRRDAHFWSCEFRYVRFMSAHFEQQANFAGARFGGTVFFNWAIFTGYAEFEDASFSSYTCFQSARFEGGGNFGWSNFQRGAKADFYSCTFLAPVVFAPKRDYQTPQFNDTEVNFGDLRLNPLDALILRDADFRRCILLDTDVRQAELTGIIWPYLGRRIAVYDEIIARDNQYRDSLSRLERLYRELKQNYEDRHDYERAGDFHYGEKDMRRRNKSTPLGLRFWLTLYWIVSGYGERYLRPLLWAVAFLLLTTALYLYAGVRSPDGPLLSPSIPSHWLRTAHFGIRTMLLLRPADLLGGEPIRVLNTAQSVVGPILFGLFGWALRQRLRR